MLGLSDRGAVRRLLSLLLEGDTAALLAAVREQYALGVEPLSLVRGLLELVHAVTLAKAGRDIANPGQSAEEREALATWASQIGFAPLHRLWQLLLKGHDEVAGAAFPIESCEMALLRVMHAATMPDPARSRGSCAKAPFRLRKRLRFRPHPPLLLPHRCPRMRRPSSICFGNKRRGGSLTSFMIACASSGSIHLNWNYN